MAADTAPAYALELQPISVTREATTADIREAPATAFRYAIATIEEPDHERWLRLIHLAEAAIGSDLYKRSGPLLIMEPRAVGHLVKVFQLLGIDSHLSIRKATEEA